MTRSLCLICLAISWFVGCLPNPALALPLAWRGRDAQREATAPLADLRYTLASLDVLDITLYSYPELGREVAISRRGTFRFPVVGQVEARGLTIAQLERLLTQRLQEARFFDPQVVVTVKVYHGRHIFMLGQVRAPGVYALPEHANLKDLILQAQGLTAEADDFLIVIDRERHAWIGKVAPVNHMRQQPGTRVDLRDLLSGQVVPEVKLQSGDTIYVPRRIAGYAASDDLAVGLVNTVRYQGFKEFR